MGSLKETRINIIYLFILASVLTGCADEQARQQISDTNQQLMVMQQSVNKIDTKLTGQNSLELLNQITELQTEIQSLNGKIAELEESQKSSQASLKSMIESNNKINQVEYKDVSLKTAIDKLHNNQLESAIIDLELLSKNSNTKIKNNAQYYLSVAYLANMQYRSAITSAKLFIANNQNDSRAPEAMRVVYVAQLQSGDKKAAKTTADKILHDFPNSKAADKILHDTDSKTANAD